MLVYVGGAKGGVGKSITSMIALDVILEAGGKPLLIETDQANPDVAKAYSSSVETIASDLDTPEGWSKTLTAIHENQDRPVVINSAARNSAGVKEFGGTFEALADLGVEMTLLWPINVQRDSLELLNEFLTVVNPAKKHVVKNGYFGREADFELFDNSKLSKRMDSAIYLPKLLENVANIIYSDRKPLHELASILPFGDKLLFEAWRKKAHKALQPIVQG